MRVSQQLTGMYGGVSRQSPDLRLPTQCEEQINFDCDPVQGMRRRNGMEFHVEAGGGGLNDCFRVLPCNGEWFIVWYHGDNHVITMHRVSNPSSNYVLTPTSSTVHIRDFLAYNGTILACYQGMLPFTQSIDNARIKGTVQAVEDLKTLSTTPTEGQVYAVVGTSGLEQTTTYYQYHAANATTNKAAYWEETWGSERIYYHGGAAFGYPPDVISWETGSPAITQMDFNSQRVGNQKNRPWPKAIVTKRNGVVRFNAIAGWAIYKDRFVVIHGDDIDFSRSGVLGDFFYNSGSVVSDDDPISISIGNAADILAVIPFADTLVVFCDQSQWVIHSGSSPFTPSTASKAATTRNSVNKDCRPVAMGANIYFVQDTTDGSNALSEYYVSNTTTNQVSTDVSYHVRGYITQAIDMTASLPDGAIFMLAADRSTIYCHRFLWSGDTKVQNAFYKYTTSGISIQRIAAHNGRLYLATNIGLCSISLATKDVPTAHVDHPREFPFSWDGLRKKWVATGVPYTLLTSGEIQNTVVVDDYGNFCEYTRTQTSGMAAWDVFVDAPQEYTGKFYFAESFTSEYIYSQQFYRDANTGEARLNYRSRFRALTMNTKNTLGFRVDAIDGQRTVNRYLWCPDIADRTRWDTNINNLDDDKRHTIMLNGWADSTQQIRIESIGSLPLQITTSGFTLDAVRR